MRKISTRALHERKHFERASVHTSHYLSADLSLQVSPALPPDHRTTDGIRSRKRAHVTSTFTTRLCKYARTSCASWENSPILALAVASLRTAGYRQAKIVRRRAAKCAKGSRCLSPVWNALLTLNFL